jgi:hypothetical protein
MRLQFSIDFQRFGVPLDAHTPAAGDTVDLAELVGG